MLWQLLLLPLLLVFGCAALAGVVVVIFAGGYGNSNGDDGGITTHNVVGFVMQCLISFWVNAFAIFALHASRCCCPLRSRSVSLFLSLHNGYNSSRKHRCSHTHTYRHIA